MCFKLEQEQEVTLERHMQVWELYNLQSVTHSGGDTQLELQRKARSGGTICTVFPVVERWCRQRPIMALRRPKKMSRPPNCTSNGSSASTVASRLGPGMETINLTFTPTHAQDSQKDMSGVDGAAELESPWFIHWQVGVGASVDRGLRLAKVVRVGVSNPGGRAGGQDIERSVFGEMVVLWAW